MYDAVREQLLALAEEKYARFSAKLLPGVPDILGVRLPALRKIARQIASDENWQQYAAGDELLYFEEKMLQGMVVGYAKLPLAEKWPYIKNFVTRIDSWSVCDSFCSTLKDTKANRDLVWAWIEPYFLSEKEYELRFAAVMALSYFMEDAYIERVLAALKNSRTDGYYAKMAVAWALSVAYVHFPGQTRTYLQDACFEIFIHNKAIQKIVESFRVEEKDKEILKGWRRRE